jgi:hypothetical protein
METAFTCLHSLHSHGLRDLLRHVAGPEADTDPDVSAAAVIRLAFAGAKACRKFVRGEGLLFAAVAAIILVSLPKVFRRHECMPKGISQHAPQPEGASPPLVRCAIYTRKSTDEGLSQEFNSLDAQRECAEAYIHSQRHAG